MRKYIDADKVIDYANQEVTAAFYYPQDAQEKRNRDEQAYRDKWAFVKQVMVGMPAADVVEVVRCADCKYQEKGDNDCEAWNLCGYRPWLYIPTEDDAFCSKGERKDG